MSDDTEYIWTEDFAVSVPKQSRTGVPRFVDWTTQPFTVLMNDPRVLDESSYHGKRLAFIKNL